MGSRPSSFVFTQSGPLRLYSLTELLALPPATWLVHKAVPAGGMVGLYGPSGIGKTFIAVDLGMCVATGLQWNDREVDKGFVLYISAEGGAGIAKRFYAWLVDHGVAAKDADIAFLLDSIAVTSDSSAMLTLVERIVNEVRRHPTLIIIDTLARCFDGNENEQEDMSRFVAGVDLLRKEFDATVLIVHHTRLDGNRERGNTAFRAAADMMMSVEGEGDRMTLKCNKMKDDREFEDIELELRPIEGTDSCVVVPNAHVASSSEVHTEMEVSLRRIEPAKFDDWVAASGLTKNVFMRHFNTLKQSGRIFKNKKSGKWTAVQTQ